MRKHLPAYMLLLYYILQLTFLILLFVWHDFLKTPKTIPAPDFKSLTDSKKRKQAFVDFVTPYIQKENLKIEKQRSDLLKLSQSANGAKAHNSQKHNKLITLAKRYQINTELNTKEILDELLLRVDIIPRAMALAQAAIESGWGTSRFTREANNIFGQWCFEKGCGVIPSSRKKGATHEIRTFNSVGDSVSAYFHNINTHHLYQAFRLKRAKMRQQNKKITALELVEELKFYSERGDEYILDVKNMIKSNKLGSLSNKKANEK